MTCAARCGAEAPFGRWRSFSVRAPASPLRLQRHHRAGVRARYVAAGRAVRLAAGGRPDSRARIPLRRRRWRATRLRHGARTLRAPVAASWCCRRRDEDLYALKKCCSMTCGKRRRRARLRLGHKWVCVLLRARRRALRTAPMSTLMRAWPRLDSRRSRSCHHTRHGEGRIAGAAADTLLCRTMSPGGGRRSTSPWPCRREVAGDGDETRGGGEGGDRRGFRGRRRFRRRPRRLRPSHGGVERRRRY